MSVITNIVIQTGVSEESYAKAIFQPIVDHPDRSEYRELPQHVRHNPDAGKVLEVEVLIVALNYATDLELSLIRAAFLATPWEYPGEAVLIISFDEPEISEVLRPNPNLKFEEKNP